MDHFIKDANFEMIPSSRDKIFLEGNIISIYFVKQFKHLSTGTILHLRNYNKISPVHEVDARRHLYLASNKISIRNTTG